MVATAATDSRTVSAGKPGLSSVTGVILAGGLGTRLRSVVSDRPKVLVEIGGRTFLSYILDQLLATGMEDVVLCTGYLGEQVKAAFGERYGELCLNYSQEPSPRGTAGALRLALPRCKSDVLLVMNGDSYCDTNLESYWRWYEKRCAKASLCLVRVPDTGRYGRVTVGADDEVTAFDEKGKEQGPGWINAGIYLLSREAVLEIPEDRAVSLEREIFPSWIGHGLHAFRNEAHFLDIGTPDDFAKAEAFFAALNVNEQEGGL
jgi:NDP-sugar pyrophosphorylase family protein